MNNNSRISLQTKAVVVMRKPCANMMKSVPQTEVTVSKKGICIIIPIPVDGTIREGLAQVRGAGIEKSVS